ncbi:MAG: hypothetical protein IKP34_06025 [Bacteroidales bacterium]|nr:hypothetical protein [Bacteroidales bacterium]
MIHFKAFKSPHVSSILRKETDAVVQNGLALTPARMLELTNQGFSISAQNARMLQEVREDVFSHMDVLPEYRRGFDPLGDGYQLQQEVHDKARHAVNNVPRPFKSTKLEE